MFIICSRGFLENTILSIHLHITAGPIYIGPSRVSALMEGQHSENEVSFCIAFPVID